jgi:Domain of unknown function (DUF4386)
MKNNIITEPLQKAAKIAGFAYLFTFVTVVYNNFGIYDKLNVPGNATETAKNILAKEMLFRFGIIVDLTYALVFLILLSSIYTILKDVNRRIVVLATFWQLVYVLTWVTLTLKFFDALRLMNGAKYLEVFEEANLFSLSKLFLNARFDRYYGVLLFYSLGSTAFSYLWYKSRYIPRPLAIWGIIACAWCTVCAVAFIIYPNFELIINPWLFDLPMAFFDITLSFWLIFKGLKLEHPKTV